MNSRTQRLIVLSGALLVALVVIAFVLNQGKGNGDAKPPEDGDKTSLTALKPGSGPPKSPEGGTPAVERVERTPQNLLAGRAMLELTPEEVEAALDAAGRTPGDLIAAQAILGEHRFLEEAAEKHPDEAEVQFWILANRVLPEERADWLSKFKESDPDNALANYLAAEQAFREMDFAAGIAELRSATEKGYRDYSDGLQESVREFYGETGRYDEETVRLGSARAIAMPHSEQIQALSQQVIAQHQRLQQEGKTEDAAELVELSMAMLETVAGNSGADGLESRSMMLLMQENLQRAAGDPGGTLESLTAERQRLGELSGRVRQIFSNDIPLGRRELDGYAARLYDLGEVEAAQWLVEQVGEIPEE